LHPFRDYMCNRNKPILITGTARSGLSMIAGAVDFCGAFGGSDVDKSYTNKAIDTKLVRPRLVDANFDPSGQYPLPTSPCMPVLIDWKRNVLSHIKADKNTHWYYKDDKISLMWNTWFMAFPEAKWVLVSRNTHDTIISCMKTAYMSAYKDVETLKLVGVNNEYDGWANYLNSYLTFITSILKKVSNIYVIRPEQMVNGDYTVLYNLIEWLGLDWNSDVLSYMDKKLEKARR